MTLVINPNNFMNLYYNFKRYNQYNKSPKKKDIRCGGIIINEKLDKIIIVLNRESKIKGENKWGLPKGHIKPNEELYQCAQREIEEETGIKFKINNNTPRIKINDTFYYILVSTEDIYLNPRDKREIAEVKWEKIENIEKMNTNRGLKKLDSVYTKIIKLATKS